MKLSELDPSEIATPPKLKLSDIHPDEIDAGGTSSTPNADAIENIISRAADLPHQAVEGYKNVVGKLPLVGDIAKTGVETMQDIATGGQEGITGGLRDEILGGVKGTGKTALEALTGELPAKKSAIQELVDNYYKYKGGAEEEQRAAHGRSPVASKVAQIGAGFVPAGRIFNAAKGLGMTGRIAAGMGLGAAQSLGESENTLRDNPEGLARDVGIGTAFGGAAVPVAEKIIAPTLTAGINKAGSFFQNQPWAKSIAAANLNAAAGGSLFNETGTGRIVKDTEDLANRTANELTKGIENKNNAFTEAFKAGADQKLAPNATNLSTISQVQDMIQKKFPGAFEDEFNALASGKMSPEQANSFRAQIKNFVSKLYTVDSPDPTIRAFAKKIGDSGIIGSLEQMSSDAGTDIAALNEGKHQAWNQLEPFIQKANRIVPVEQQVKNASSMPIEEARNKIADLTRGLAERSGRSTGLGSKARNTVQDMQELLEQIQGKSDMGINPSQIASDIQNQGYLNAAKTSVEGIQTSKINPMKYLDFLNPYRAAEKLSGSKVAQDISGRILGKDPMQMRAAIMALGKNPKTSKLAQDLMKAHELNDSQKITNAAFQIMQSPIAKEALGMGPNDNTGSEIPGVVNSNEGNR